MILFCASNLTRFRALYTASSENAPEGAVLSESLALLGVLQFHTVATVLSDELALAAELLSVLEFSLIDFLLADSSLTESAKWPSLS